MYDAIIIANGDIPSSEHWQTLPHQTLICTDGAVHYLNKNKITPQIIIGDMDSIPDDLKNARAQNIKTPILGSRLIEISDQNTTDFEKALEFAKQQQMRRICCIGIMGKSADHTLYNLSLLYRFQNDFEILAFHTFEDQYQWIFPLGTNTQIEAERDATLSFWPLQSSLITTTGLAWDLKSAPMTPIKGIWVRNEVRSPQVHVHIEGACLCILTAKNPPIIKSLQA